MSTNNETIDVSNMKVNEVLEATKDFTTDELLTVANQYKNVPVPLTARILGKAKPYVYMGLRNKRLPFGTAVQTNPKSSFWTYQISPKLLEAYVKGTMYQS